MTPREQNLRNETVPTAADAPEADEFAELTRALESALIPRQPREAFADELRARLDAEKATVSRLRGLAPGLPVAAVVALAAGFLLLMLRRLTGGEDASDLADDPLPSSA